MASHIPKLDRRKETKQVEETASRNWDGVPPELLNMIFNHLPVPDLLSCSVVSKTWKKAARDVLKRSRECYAYIYTQDFPQDVFHLIVKIASTDLMQMVNGLHFKIRPKYYYENVGPSSSSSSSRRQELSCLNINYLKWKETRHKLINVALSGQIRYLTLDMEHKWEEGLALDNVVLLRELISDTSESLQKLVVWQDESCKFLSSCGKEFSKLKVVQVQYEGFLDESFLKEFLPKFAPNLEEITGSMLLVALNNEENHFILKRSKNLYVFHDEMNPEVFTEGYRYIFELCRLDLRVCHCNSFDDGTILFSMLLKSLNTLEQLRIYTPEFYNLFKTSDQLKFSNLRRLSLATHMNMPVGNEIVLLKQLNLPKLCPNLEQLELCLDQDDHEDDTYNEQDFTPTALPYGTDQSGRPLQIEIEYREDHLTHEYFEFLYKIYPKINRVCLLEWELGKSFHEMSSIFLDIPSLEYLEINVDGWVSHALDFQVDALLCGISIEEAQFLVNSSPRTANVELNPCIVPTRPSLFNAKNLKELKIIGEANCPHSVVSRSWVIQVTENLPVRHVRDLKVTFYGMATLYNHLNRLKAFKTLLCTE